MVYVIFEYKHFYNINMEIKKPLLWKVGNPTHDSIRFEQNLSLKSTLEHRFIGLLTRAYLKRYLIYKFNCTINAVLPQTNKLFVL